MTGSHSEGASARRVYAAVATGAFLGLGALAAAGSASANPCDPAGAAMTPQPILSCPGAAVPPAEVVPASNPGDPALPPVPPASTPPPIKADASGNPSYNGFTSLMDMIRNIRSGGLYEDVYGPAGPVPPPAAPVPPGAPLPPAVSP